MDESGGAYIGLSDGEVRDSVQLDELEDAGRIVALESMVLHFDFYGRLIGIEVTSAATRALPPGLIDRRVSLQRHVDRHAIRAFEKQLHAYAIVGDRGWEVDFDPGMIHFDDDLDMGVALLGTERARLGVGLGRPDEDFPEAVVAPRPRARGVRPRARPPGAL